MTSQKNGIPALGLQRVLGMGSYQTAWAMLHHYRRAMVRPGRERLAGRVEVDEVLIGGLTPGRKGRQIGARVLVEVAVEQLAQGFGRCRMEIIAGAGSATLRRFLLDHVDDGTTVVSDGWQGYRSAAVAPYRHERHVVGRPERAHQLLPGVHRVASLVKRWLLGTHQGGIADTHLQDYLDEFAFRCNRRTSRARGLLFFRLPEQAVATDPVRYGDLVVTPGAGNRNAHPPGAKRIAPDTLALAALDRPWRNVTR